MASLASEFTALFDLVPSVVTPCKSCPANPNKYLLFAFALLVPLSGAIACTAGWPSVGSKPSGLTTDSRGTA